MEDGEEDNHWNKENWLAKGKMIARDEKEAKTEKIDEVLVRILLHKRKESTGHRSRGAEPEDAALQERLSELNPDKYIKFCKDACDEKIPARTANGLGLLCPCCAKKEETMIHSLRECAHARISSSTFKEFLSAVTRVLKDDKDLALFVLICWFLWEARNDYVEHRIVPNLADILRNALLLLEEASRWVKDKLRHQLIADMARSGPGQWKQPPNGWLKMNVEAYLSGRMMAMGAVVRDDNGRFFAAVSMSRKYALKNLLLAQSLALDRALIWAENSAMIHHQKTLHFARASDQENRLAYGLAGLAARKECEGSWVASGVPEWLQEAVKADVPH